MTAAKYILLIIELFLLVFIVHPNTNLDLMSPPSDFNRLPVLKMGLNLPEIQWVE
jgi:hypothetical protein